MATEQRIHKLGISTSARHPEPRRALDFGDEPVREERMAMLDWSTPDLIERIENLEMAREAYLQREALWDILLRKYGNEIRRLGGDVATINEEFPMKETCGQCRFFKPVNEEQKARFLSGGWCGFQPPVDMLEWGRQRKNITGDREACSAFRSIGTI